MKMPFFVIVAAFLLAACSHKYRTDSFEPPAEQIVLSGSAYVMLADDGAYGNKIYPGSGSTLSREVSAAISRYLNAVQIGIALEDRNQVFEKARTQEIEYVFEPVILHWEDRSTEWSGKPDRVAIKIIVWNPVDGEAISTGVERASSKWGTFGGDHPQDLLPHLLEMYADRLLR